MLASRFLMKPLELELIFFAVTLRSLEDAHCRCPSEIQCVKAHPSQNHTSKMKWWCNRIEQVSSIVDSPVSSGCIILDTVPYAQFIH